MKKLLTLLFIFFVGNIFAQDMKLDHSYINPAGFVVGDTITVKFYTLDENSALPTLVQYDFQWNNKLLEFIDYTWKVTGNGTNSTAQTAWTSWTGYTFNGDTGYDASYLTTQYDSWNAGGAYYSDDADWNVGRITIQDAVAIEHNDTHIEVRFSIKNINSTNYTHYSETTKLNWARAEDNSTGTVYDVDGMTMSIDLGNVSVPTDGGVTIKVDVPHSNKSDMGYSIYHNTQLDATNGYPKQGELPEFSGNFDANGEVVLTDLYLDESYFVGIYANKGTDQWLDEVITVTDVYKIFQYSLDTDIDGGGNSWEYDIQDALGEVTNDQTVDFDDSYELLAHINGITTSNNVTSDANGAFNLSGILGTFGVPGPNFLDNMIKPQAGVSVFTFGHGLRGDLDFSHSTEPTADDAKNMTVSNAAKTSTQRILMSKAVEQANLDISSRLEGGKVLVDISTTKAGMIGVQFNISFDDTMLELDDIIYDTGNEMTNFGNVKGNKVSFGSLDYKGDVSVKTGTPYKLIFTPKQQLTNTAGLVTFKITEGVKQDGTKVKLNIQ
jgi:hypothetical protein